MNACACTGLQLYNFGSTISLPFFTDTWKPSSFYDRLAQNAAVGAHTLVLLDIKVKEQSEENMARGRKIFEPPRYMGVDVAVSQLIEVEGERKEGHLDPETTLIMSLSRVGAQPGESGDDESQKIVCGTLAELAALPAETFGSPLHSVIIVGKRLHELEVEYGAQFAVGDGWRRVAKEVYKVVD
jgi:diphthine synthase